MSMDMPLALATLAAGSIASNRGGGGDADSTGHGPYRPEPAHLRAGEWRPTLDLWYAALDYLSTVDPQDAWDLVMTLQRERGIRPLPRHERPLQVLRSAEAGRLDGDRPIATSRRQVWRVIGRLFASLAAYDLRLLGIHQANARRLQDLGRHVDLWHPR